MQTGLVLLDNLDLLDFLDSHYLNYAREDVFGFVLRSNHKKTADQELAMKALTNTRVDAAIKNNFTFYPPYRLHVAREKDEKNVASSRFVF